MEIMKKNGIKKWGFFDRMNRTGFNRTIDGSVKNHQGTASHALIDQTEEKNFLRQGLNFEE